MIAEHKTASTHGAATVAINKTEAQLLMRFDHSLLMLAHVFVNTTKTPMTQSNVSTVAFANSGYADYSIFHQLAMTHIHEKHPEKRHDMASHMCLTDVYH